MRKIFAVLFALTAACGPSIPARSLEVSKGVWEIDCSTAIGPCSDRAYELCKGRGYDVLSGFDRPKRLGHESGESQVETRSSRLVVVCSDHDGSSRVPEGATSAAPAPLAPPKTPPPRAKSERAAFCMPGATQRCFGPGACEGGQSCLPDGKAFGPCDCGPARSMPQPGAPAGGAPETPAP